MYRETHLEQEDVFSAVAAMYGELARALLAGDDVQLGGKGCNGHHRLACYVSPRHRQLQPLYNNYADNNNDDDNDDNNIVITILCYVGPRHSQLQPLYNDNDNNENNNIDNDYNDVYDNSNNNNDVMLCRSAPPAPTPVQ